MQAILAAIIVVSLRKMFLKVREVVVFARKSTFDGLVWVVAFSATIVLDVIQGLVLALALNLAFLLYQSLNPKLQVLGETEFEDVNLDPKIYHDVSVVKKIFILTS